MPLTPYKDLLNLSSEDRDKKNAPTKINKQKKKGELKLAEVEEVISTLEDKVTALCSVNELDFIAIVDAQDNLALAQRRREQLVKVIEELFPPAEEVKTA